MKMFFRGLILIFLCVGFQILAQETEAELKTNVFAEVAALAKTNTAAAVQKLRDAKNLDPERFFSAFNGLDAAACFQLLNEICKDESLANRFVFDRMSLGPSFPLTQDYKTPPKNLEPKDLLDYLNNQQIQPLFQATPEDMPPVLVIPALGHIIQMNHFIFALALASDNSRSSNNLEFAELMTQDIKVAATPAEFQEILSLISVLARIKIEGVETVDATASQAASARIAALLEEANLPLSVRLGFAGLKVNDHQTRSDETVILTGEWLASALEQKIPVSSGTAPDLLKRFLEARRHPGWKAVATRILAASSDLNARDDKCYPWLIGIAAALGERERILELKANAAESNRELAVDPMFALLVREGFFDLAHQEIKKRNRELLLTQLNDFLRHDQSFKAVQFDEKLEANVAKLTETITNSDLKFIVELHLKLLPDHPEFPPQSAHAERIRAMALRLETLDFKEPSAKYTALRMIGQHPEIAATITDVYLKYAQFDQVSKNLNHIFRGEAWAEIATDAFAAILVAEEYESAEMILLKIAESTTGLGQDRGAFLDDHNQLWKEILEILTAEIQKQNFSPELLPLARFVNLLPRKYFPPLSDYALGNFFEATLERHAQQNEMATWWKWHHNLSPKARKSHDMIVINSILGRDFIREGPATWSEQPQFEPTPEDKSYLDLIKIFREISHDQLTEKRIAAALRACSPSTPAAISIFYRYRYLSGEEILQNADQFIAALPEKDPQKWADLARVADEAGKKNLAKQFRERAK